MFKVSSHHKSSMVTMSLSQHASPLRIKQFSNFLDKMFLLRNPQGVHSKIQLSLVWFLHFLYKAGKFLTN
jgi:hypothetical protein